MFPNGTYNKSVYWHSSFDTMTKNKMRIASLNGVSYTKHYKEKVFERRLFRIPKVRTLLYGEVFEVTINNGEVEKCLVRTRYNPSQDIVTCVSFVNGHIEYITGWTNLIEDHHANMDKSKYVQEVTLNSDEKVV